MFQRSAHHQHCHNDEGRSTLTLIKTSLSLPDQMGNFFAQFNFRSPQASDLNLNDYQLVYFRPYYVPVKNTSVLTSGIIIYFLPVHLKDPPLNTYLF